VLKYQSVQELLANAQSKGKTISEVVLEDQSLQMEQPKEIIFEEMRRRLCLMRQSVRNGMGSAKMSASGLSGGDAKKMQAFARTGRGLIGNLFDHAITMALAVSEQNACMGKIVASPTAGSCGILPAAILTVMESKGVSEEKAVLSLFTAAGIGMVISNRASISGAEGGCQAECGSAAAMAAAALVELDGGTPVMAAHGCAISLKNVLGLVCDPVAGLVEVPCVKRNAMGVINAFAAAEMALAGIESRIPADEVIDAMKLVGQEMPSSLKETAKGGLANTPAGKSYRVANLKIK